MITKEDIVKYEDKCILCKRDKFDKKNRFVYQLTKVKEDKDGRNDFDNLQYIQIVNSNGRGYYCEILICENCWISVAGPEWEMEGE